MAPNVIQYNAIRIDYLFCYKLVSFLTRITPGWIDRAVTFWEKVLSAEIAGVIPTGKRIEKIRGTSCRNDKVTEVVEVCYFIKLLWIRKTGKKTNGQAVDSCRC